MLPAKCSRLRRAPAIATKGPIRKIACLDAALKELSIKFATLSKDMAETLKWNDRVALRNEDMRIFPRCLDNPGPNSQNITDVFANSCAKVSAQTWMLAKPYH